MKKVGGAFVSVSLWITTSTVLLACILLGRLFFAPIDVGFARGQIIERAADVLPGWNVRFAQARVGWDWREVRPWVVLEDVRLVDRRNRLTASLPRAEVGLGFAGILSGLGVSTIEIENANVRISDLGGFSDTTDDSLFDDLFGESGIPQPEVFIPLTEAFNRFTLRLLDNAPALSRVGFNRLSVSIYRGEDLSEAQIAVSSFDLRQTGEDLTLAAQLEAAVGGNPIKTRLAGRANPTRGDLSILLGVNDFNPSAIPADTGLPALLQYIQVPIDLSLELDMNASVGLQSAGIEAVLGEGEIFGGDVFPNRAPVTYGLIGATFNVAENILVFDQIRLDLKNQLINGEGLMYWHQTNAKPGMQFELRTTDLPVLNVLDYWPIARHPDGRERGARAWISQHMISGNTTDVMFNVDVAPSGEGAFADGSTYQLTFEFDNLDTLFMRTMPPILGAKGSANLTRKQLDINVQSGTLLGMPVDGSQAKLKNIHIRDGAVGEFTIFTRGDVQTVMSLVDNPPLRVAQKANLDISRLGGTAAVKAVVTAPLLKQPPPGSTLYDVTAQISDARVDDLLDGEGLRNGQLSVSLSQDELTAAGTGFVNGVPLGLRWHENFVLGREDPGSETTLIVMNGDMDASDLQKLGVDVEDFLDGKAYAEASFQGRNFKFTRGSFSADASTAKLNIPQLAWSKPVGRPATITGGVVFTDNGSTVAPLKVEGEEIDLLASINFGPKDSGIFDAEIQARQVGRNQLIATLSQEAGVPLSVKVEAEAFDLGAFLAQENSQRAGAETGTPQVSNEQTNFDLDLNADAILLENGEQWDAGKLSLEFRDGEPSNLHLDATIGDDQTPIQLSIVDEPVDTSGIRPFQASTSNGGQVLRGLGFFAHVDGGELSLDGTTSGWGNTWQIDGVLNVGSSTLLSKELLGEDVTEGVIAGLDEFLTDGRLELDVLEVPFSYNGDILELSNLKANGPTLGLTMEGEIATAQGLINVNGVVVPAYGINSLLGNIPIVGGLFSGGDGKGLFGVAYRVKGTTDEPDVNVNTLSGLAPGFLRLLFEGRKGRVADVEAPEVQAESQTQDDPLDPSGDGG
ncbi:MAG: AsmA-like C-terminal domain-containing protein [Kordiimonadaceae bacterium]|nr:AsmA-like C-terminal domain-containing protein [Kordiimonadaceae bacterium]MBO6570148.1 AsmA-like C-terminal domain-containing protein [Kordiimonadaceae bacterium]MBO6965754.1 AsmA-like C-terminal domain-containing protein [Kordiimonadaceae bacterium]